MSIVVVSIAVVTAVCFGLFIFLLFPKAAKRDEVQEGAVVAPQVGPVQQGSIGARLVAAAPKGYIGWLEKQIVYAGRPNGWTPNALAVWKIVLPIVALLLGLLVLSRTG